MPKVYDYNTEVDGRRITVPIHFTKTRRFHLPSDIKNSPLFKDIMERGVFKQLDLFPTPEQLEAYIDAKLDGFKLNTESKKVIIVMVNINHELRKKLVEKNISPSLELIDFAQRYKHSYPHSYDVDFEYHIGYYTPSEASYKNESGFIFSDQTLESCFIVDHTPQREEALVNLESEIDEMMALKLYRFFGKTDESMAKALDSGKSIFDF